MSGIRVFFSVIAGCSVTAFASQLMHQSVVDPSLNTLRVRKNIVVGQFVLFEDVGAPKVSVRFAQDLEDVVNSRPIPGQLDNSCVYVGERLAKRFGGITGARRSARDVGCFVKLSSQHAHLAAELYQLIWAAFQSCVLIGQ